MKKLTIGVVGAGIYGEYHVRTFINNPDVERVVVCDRNPDILQKVKDLYGLTGYAQVSEMIASENLDGVSICTPDPYHFEPLKSVIEGGVKKILCEKPLATTKHEIDEIVNLAKTYNAEIMVDFHKRWDPAYNSIKKSLKSQNDHVVRGYMSLDDIIDVPLNWFNWTDKSSPAWFVGTHCYDLIRYITESEVKEVYAVSSNKVMSSLGHKTEDNITAILTMEDGSTWTVENAWILPNSFPKSNDGQLVIISEKQYFKNESYRGLTSYDQNKPNIPNYIFMDFDGEPSGFGLEPMIDFIQNIVNGKPYRSVLKDGYQASLIALAVHESAKTGKIVKVNQTAI